MARASAVTAVEGERDERRLSAQCLTGPTTRTVVQVVDRLLAVQAQDLRAARLAIRARTSGFTAADVNRELQERTLVVTWLNRGTLHLVRAPDYWWLQRLTAPQLASGNARRLAQEGVSPEQADRGVAAIEAAIGTQGPMNRAQLREIVASADVPVAGQALVHILALSAIRGLTVRGPMVGREQGFVLVRDWLGEPAPGASDRDTELSLLARRFLAGHGPADERDLSKWAGITVGDARRGLRGLGPELEERPGGLVDLTGRRTFGRNLPKLLGGFDPLLHGWVDRAPVLGGNQRIVTTNGVFRPFALVAGRAVAIWSMPRGRVALEPFGRLPAPVREELGREAADVERFLGTDH